MKANELRIGNIVLDEYLETVYVVYLHPCRTGDALVS
jgi:hypothetical protein